mmetsp:Transcript_63419/g.148934  ORF Transcript_63419/g.148934 Transcript_63419/m.148934 type:complete len:361 (-) Transcript_63419:80-1162(-)
MDQMVSSYAGLVSNIDGASDSTKQALLDTVNTSSSVLLKKLDVTQQDLLKQTQESHAVLQGVASTQTTLAKKVDSGNEFTQRRLVEMESCVERKVNEIGTSLALGQTTCAEGVLNSLRADLGKLAEQGNAMVDCTEKSMQSSEENMADLRRQNLTIMDLLTSTQANMHTTAESLENFTRTEIMRDSAANMEMQIRDAIVYQFSKMQDAILGDGDGEGREGDKTSLKAAINSMVAKLDQSASRLEFAHNNQAASNNQDDINESIRRELAAVAMALSQQQRDTAQESVVQLGEAVKAHLEPLKDAQSETAVSLTRQVTELSTSVNQGVERLEAEVDKVLQTVEAAATKPSASEKRASRVDRG